ncbi:uncharacterized protein LOC135220365 [Macrobrachium nipponense]|uniref:uncharacterized protein LOC135220365 n=1 Tax=Macrobrachium nipponense TaxID=159736 RepID=UPI0030C807D8
MDIILTSPNRLQSQTKELAYSSSSICYHNHHLRQSRLDDTIIIIVIIIIVAAVFIYVKVQRSKNQIMLVTYAPKIPASSPPPPNPYGSPDLLTPTPAVLFEFIPIPCLPPCPQRSSRVSPTRPRTHGGASPPVLGHMPAPGRSSRYTWQASAACPGTRGGSQSPIPVHVAVPAHPWQALPTCPGTCSGTRPPIPVHMVVARPPILIVAHTGPPLPYQSQETWRAPPGHPNTCGGPRLPVPGPIAGPACPSRDP